MGIEELRKVLRENPAMANVVITAGDRRVSLAEALGMLNAGIMVEQIMGGLAAIGIDPPEDTAREAEEYFRRLSNQPGPKPKILIASEQFDFNQATREIAAKTAVGNDLIQAYQKMKDNIAKKM